MIDLITKNTLNKEAVKAKNNSYSPHSNFKVGAAILTSSNEIFIGTNIEFDAYSLTVCAERSAVFNAVSNGYKEFTAIAISTDRNDFKYPCGLCRQALVEFNPEMEIFLINKSGKCKKVNLKQLIPNFFKL
jgi:cytidine deaminase